MMVPMVSVAEPPDLGRPLVIIVVPDPEFLAPRDFALLSFGICSSCDLASTGFARITGVSLVPSALDESVLLPMFVAPLLVIGRRMSLGMSSSVGRAVLAILGPLARKLFRSQVGRSRTGDRGSLHEGVEVNRERWYCSR
jgi:hypothetical protein